MFAPFMRQIAFFVIVLTCAAAVHGQVRYVGEVVELIDGKTVVVAIPNGRIKVELQHIDVPEPGQPLHQTVKEHLQQLVLRKVVDYKPKTMMSNRTIGQISQNGIDISQQMLRDGAAWHIPAEKTGQDANESSVYGEAESQAKAEKLGIWSIAGLKPAWQVRAENEEKQRLAEAANWQAGGSKKVGVDAFRTAGRAGATTGRSAAADLDAWAEVSAGVGKESVGLQTYNDPQGRFNVVYTSFAFVNLASGGSKQRVECRVGYVYGNLPDGRRQATYMLGFRSISEDFKFSRQKSTLTVTADNQKIALGLANGYKGETTYGVHELFFYRISKSALSKIANAKNVEIKINGMSGTLAPQPRELFKQLLASMN
jgi:micrococcal nuclease